VTLSGVVQSDSEREAMRRWLAALPWVELQAMAPDGRPPGPPVLIGQAVPAQSVRRAPLRSYLEKVFPIDGDREQYVAQTLDASQRLLAEAAALRRIAERYNPDEVALLVSPSRASLESVIQDYLAAMRQDAIPFSRLLAATGEMAPAAADVPPGGWRECATTAFRAAQGLQERVTWLLTEGPATEDQTPIMLRELAGYLARLNSVLDALAARTPAGFLEKRPE
jgi:hypothetical protein